MNFSLYFKCILRLEVADAKIKLESRSNTFILKESYLTDEKDDSKGVDSGVADVLLNINTIGTKKRRCMFLMGPSGS